MNFLRKINCFGVVSMIVASIVGKIAALSYIGPFLKSTAAIFAAILAAVLTVLIAILIKGSFYVMKEADDVQKKIIFIDK